jgi:diguanylate cyclase (GGDEF)-like protein
MHALVVDDERATGHRISEALEARGFTVDVVYSGAAALDTLQKVVPDLIVLDRQMPGIDGLEVLEKVRSNPFLAQIPVLMLTPSMDADERMRAYDVGVDDYVVKPFHVRELAAKAGALIRLARRNLERNPTTNLPGADALENAIHERLKAQQPVAVCHADLDNFKAFADSHGFEQANQVIAVTARILTGVCMLEGDGAEFVGHLGGDDFVLVLPEPAYQRVCKRILEEFDAQRSRFHTPQEVAQGHYTSRDRRGRKAKFPLMSISVAAVSTAQGKYSSASAIGEALVEKKKRAKRIRGSSFVA